MSNLCVIAKNVLNLYAEPSSDAEMVTQALMGQPAWILEASGDWARIRTWDSYTGWAVCKWMIERPDDLPYASGPEIGVVQALVTEVRSKPLQDSELLTMAVVSTELEVISQDDLWREILLPDGRTGYTNVADVYLTPSGKRLPALPKPMVRTAKRFIGVPYLWGGTTPFGLDCSGFVQLVYRIHGITLPRDSGMQAKDDRASPVARDQLTPTDLVFFAGGEDKAKVTHVGMWIGDGRFIHSAGDVGVAISRLDEKPYSSIYHGSNRPLT